MRYRATFITGLAVGFVLGARAGRERYEQMKTLARRATDNPAVQQAAGTAAAQATGLAKTARDKVQQRTPGFADTAIRKAGERLPGRAKRAGTGAEPGAETGAVPGAETGAVPGAETGAVPGAETGAVPGAGTDEPGAGTDGVPSVPAPGGPADG